MRRTRVIPVLSIILAAVCLTAVSAYWSDYGTQVSFTLGEVQSMVMTDDGAGGAIVAWHEHVDGVGYAARIQRIDRRGDLRWDPDDLILEAHYADAIAVASDGAGGAIVAWCEHEGSDEDILIQRVDHEGNMLWTPGGVVVAGTSYNERNPVMCEDGIGGAFIVWQDDRSGTYDLRIQRFDRNGLTSFPPNGVPVSETAGYKMEQCIVPGAAGSAIILWRDQRNANDDLYAQKFDTTGVPLWTVDTPVCTESSIQSYPRMIPTEAGGAIVAWTDGRNGKSDIFAQAIRPTGGVYWTADGVEVCAHIYAILWPGGLVSDGHNGAIVTWYDARNGNLDIFAQHLVDKGGARPWGDDGLPVCVTTGSKSNLAIVPDGEGGALIAWKDYRSLAHNEIYAQRLYGNGAPQWTLDGEPVIAGGENDLGDLQLLPDPGRGMLLAWLDDFHILARDIYAYYFTLDGLPLIPEPRILSVDDVPGDEGGWVRLHVRAAPYDDPEAFYDIVTGYNIWRMIPAGLAAYAVGNRLSAAEAAAIGLPPGDWESLGFHGAMMLQDYYFTVPTRTDSTDGSTAVEYYAVSAHTTTPTVVHVSEVGEGYSVDNLAPGMPPALAGEQSFDPAGLDLTWDRVVAGDLSHYAVYRGTDESFVPDQGSLIGSPSGAGWFDAGWSWEAGYWYKVSAVDRHGNESVFAVLGPDMVTGDDPSPLPDAAFLAQNWPNPFNPSTTIAFGLAERAHVSLRVYDAAGRLAATLAEGTLPAGNHAIEWDGRGADGIPAASGVYFYRLRAGAFEETRKMILLR